MTNLGECADRGGEDMLDKSDETARVAAGL